MAAPAPAAVDHRTTSKALCVPTTFLQKRELTGINRWAGCTRPAVHSSHTRPRLARTTTNEEQRTKNEKPHPLSLLIIPKHDYKLQIEYSILRTPYQRPTGKRGEGFGKRTAGLAWSKVERTCAFWTLHALLVPVAANYKIILYIQLAYFPLHAPLPHVTLSPS